VNLNLWDLVWQATWLVQLVILLLIAASVLSWAVIVFKWREFSGAQQDSDAFLGVYHEGTWDAAYEAARDYERSPLAAIFLAAWLELKRIAKYRGAGMDAPLQPSHLKSVSRQISWSAAEELSRLESRLAFLATTGSAAPFVGLFGTVIGIINAFHEIGAAGSASLAVVAPGIAEALIATAVGLLAAIPATIAYNMFVGRMRDLHSALDLFSAELESDVAELAHVASAPPRAAEA